MNKPKHFHPRHPRNPWSAQKHGVTVMENKPRSDKKWVLIPSIPCPHEPARPQVNDYRFYNWRQTPVCRYLRRSGSTGVSRIISNLARQYDDSNLACPFPSCAYDAIAAIRTQKTMAVRHADFTNP